MVGCLLWGVRDLGHDEGWVSFSKLTFSLFLGCMAAYLAEGPPTNSV